MASSFYGQFKLFFGISIIDKTDCRIFHKLNTLHQYCQENDTCSQQTRKYSSETLTNDVYSNATEQQR